MKHAKGSLRSTCADRSRRILLIQHDPANARSVRRALIHSENGPFEIEWVRRCSEAVECLARDGPSQQSGEDGIAAVVVDLFLPDSQGLETFDRLQVAAPRIPMLVLSDAEDEDIARLAVRRGAQDYLLNGRADRYVLPKVLARMVEHAANADAVFADTDRARVTLDSIGDAVVSTDVRGRVTYLNAVAERMTGWLRVEAAGHPLEDVLHIVDATTRECVPNPLRLAIRDDKTVALTPNCVLIRRDGFEAAIEDSAAPIHDHQGRATGAVMVFRDVSASRALSLRLSHLAQHDGLTDLPNRALLNDRLIHAIAVAQRHRQKLAVLFVDVDRLKHINDSLGHATGDRLLQSLAQRLRAGVRSSDTVSRYGGDEFVILLEDVSSARDVAASAEKLLAALGESHRIGHHDLHLTVSIGIAHYPDDGTEAQSLMTNADAAMYFAKDRAGNNYQFFHPGMNVGAAGPS